MKSIVAVFLLLSLLATASLAADLPKLRVGYIPEPAHGLYFVARDKGYFKEEGVDVELFQFGSAAEGKAALKAEKLDVGTFGTTAPLLVISKGSEFAFIGGIMIGKESGAQSCPLHRGILSQVHLLPHRGPHGQGERRQGDLPSFPGRPDPCLQVL